jgi:hypothetical protein
LDYDDARMNPVLKKLLYKGQSPVLLLGAPPEAAALAKAFGAPMHSKPAAGTKYGFVLAFARSLSELDAIARTAAGALADGALFWSAYPKGTSKKYKGADINRDTGHARMKAHGFDGVSLVALDGDWSAMRFIRSGGVAR